MNLYLVQLALFYIHALIGLSNGARYPFKDGLSIVNVLDYGAIGNGVNDDTQAFLQAWNDACTVPTLLIPQGRIFSVSPITLSGPCKSAAVHIQIDGKIVAPSNREGWTNCNANSWIVFDYITNLAIDGLGVIDGQGSSWWTSYLAIDDINPELPGGGSCNYPQALSFNSCNGLRIGGVTLLNSPRAHMSISGCSDVIIANIKIQAPADSPNTDGIDISNSNQVQIHDSDIGSGTYYV